MGWQALLARAGLHKNSSVHVSTLGILGMLVVLGVLLRLIVARRTRREHEFFEEQAWRLKRSGIKLVRPGRPIWPDAQDNDSHRNWTLDGEIKDVAARRIGRAGQRVGPRPLDLVPDRHGLFPLRKSEVDPSSR